MKALIRRLMTYRRRRELWRELDAIQSQQPHVIHNRNTRRAIHAERSRIYLTLKKLGDPNAQAWPEAHK